MSEVRVEREIVDPGANTEAVFQHRQPDSHSESPTTKTTHLIPQFCLIEKKLDTVANWMSVGI